MADPQLAELQTTCDKARSAYLCAREALAAAVGKSPDSDAVKELIASTQGLGLNATLLRLKTKDPKIEEAITAMVEASDMLSLAVGSREHYLERKNPKHQRVYVDDGREFKLDMEKGLWTYLDDPDRPIKVTITKDTKLPYDIQGMKTPDPAPAKKKRKSRSL